MNAPLSDYAQARQGLDNLHARSAALGLRIETLEAKLKETTVTLQVLRRNIDVSTINNSARCTRQWAELADMADRVIAKYL